MPPWALSPLIFSLVWGEAIVAPANLIFTIPPFNALHDPLEGEIVERHGLQNTDQPQLPLLSRWRLSRSYAVCSTIHVTISVILVFLIALVTDKNPAIIGVWKFFAKEIALFLIYDAFIHLAPSVAGDQDQLFQRNKKKYLFVLLVLLLVAAGFLSGQLTECLYAASRIHLYHQIDRILCKLSS